MSFYKDFTQRTRVRLCISCGYAAELDVGVRYCPKCGKRWPPRNKEYDELAKRKVSELKGENRNG